MIPTDEIPEEIDGEPNSMKVYLVVYSDYDGGAVDAVCSSKEKAEKALEKLIKDGYGTRQHYYIEGWTVNGTRDEDN